MPSWTPPVLSLIVEARYSLRQELFALLDYLDRSIASFRILNVVVTVCLFNL